MYFAYETNIKTNLIEEYVNFVDLTKKQKTYSTRIINLFVVILCLFLNFLLFKNQNE